MICRFFSLFTWFTSIRSVVPHRAEDCANWGRNSVFVGTDGDRHGHVFHADMSFLQWVPCSVYVCLNCRRFKHHIRGDEHPFTSLLIASCPPKCGWPSPKARWIAFWVTFAPEPTTRPWKCTARTHDFAPGVVGLKRFDWHLRFFFLPGTFKSHCLDGRNPQLWCLSHRAFGNGFKVSMFQPRPSWIAKAPAIGWPSSRVKFPLDRFRWSDRSGAMAMPTRAVAYSAAPRRPWLDLLVIWDPRSEDGHRGNLQESHGRNPINETWSQHISSLASGENQTKLNEFPKKISHGRSVMPIRTCTLCRWVTRSCWNRLSLLSSGGCSRYGVFQWGRAASYSIAPCRTISMGNKSNGDVNYRTHTCAHLCVCV